MADAETIGALQVRLFAVERQLERLDDQGSRGLVALKAQMDDLRRDVERLGAADAAKLLAVLEERSKAQAEFNKDLTDHIESLKSRITAFGFTVAGGAVLFAITTLAGVFH